MPKTVMELRDVKTHEVSIVDKGANKKGRFPIFKQESQMDEEIMKAVLETEVDEENSLADYVTKSELDDKGAMALKAALRILKSFKDKLTPDALNTLATIAGYEEPVSKAAPPKEAKKEDMEEEEEEEALAIKKSLDGMPDEVKEHFEAITKAQEEITKAQEDKIVKLEKALKQEQDRRELETWVAKAREDLVALPGKTPEEHGEAFKKMADADPKLAEDQYNILKSAADAVKKSALYSELGGRGQDTTGTAYSKIMKKAEQLIEKSSESMTKEQAFQKALVANPELYNDYMIENPAQGGR
jgi:hypothetical protein